MLKEKFIEIIKNNNLILSGDRVLVAVSGGPDSVCLLHLFNEIKNDLNIHIFVGHLNHCFRGEESDNEAEFVRQLCRELKIRCTIAKKNIPEIIGSKKSISTQDVSRKYRYEFLIKTAKKYNCNIIATAHNLEDQTETVLLHFLRGSGSKGMAGIKPDQDLTDGIKLIRPFLGISRREIEGYLKKKKTKFCQDSSNLKDHYLRNNIRHNLIPVLKKKYNPNLDESVSRLAKIMSDEDDYLKNKAKLEVRKIVKFADDQCTAEIKKLKKLHPALLKRVIREIILMQKGDLNKITYDTVESVVNILNSPTGKRFDITDKLSVASEYSNLIFSGKKKNVHPYKYTLPVPSETNLEKLGIRVTIALIDNYDKNDRHADTAFFSFDKIPDKLFIRNRLAGDRFTPSGMKGSKKIKDFFIDLKVPAHERDNVPLLLNEKEILWIVNFRRSEKNKVNKSSKNIVMVKVDKI